MNKKELELLNLIKESTEVLNEQVGLNPSFGRPAGVTPKAPTPKAPDPTIARAAATFNKPTTVGPDTSRYNPKPAPKPAPKPPAVAGNKPNMTIGAVQARQRAGAEYMKNNPGDRQGYMNVVQGKTAAPAQQPTTAGKPPVRTTSVTKPPAKVTTQPAGRKMKTTTRTISKPEDQESVAGKIGRGAGKAVGAVVKAPFQLAGGFLKGVGSALGGGKKDTEPNKSTETKQSTGGRVDTGKGVSYTVNPKGIFGGVGQKAASNAASGKDITAGTGGTGTAPTQGRDRFVKPSPLDPGTPASPTQPKEELPPTNPEAETTIGVNPDSSPVSARPTTPTVSRMDQLKQFQADGVLSPRQEKELENLTRIKELDDTESEETGVGVLSPRQKAERDRRDQINVLQNMRTAQGGLTADQQKELASLEAGGDVKTPSQTVNPVTTQTPTDKPSANVYATDTDADSVFDYRDTDGNLIKPGVGSDSPNVYANTGEGESAPGITADTTDANTGEGESAPGITADTTRTPDEDAELTRLRNQNRNAPGPLDPGFNQAQHVKNLERELELETDPKRKQELQNAINAFDPENPLFEQQYVSNARIAGIKRKLRLNHPLTLEEQAILRNNPYSRF